MNNIKKIKYSNIDYIIVRTDVYEGDTDVCLYSFNTMRNAKSYAIKDIQDTMKNFGAVFSKENNGEVEYSNDCGNDYWFYSNHDNLTISWEIRKIHNRTTSEWENPNEGCKWVKDNH